MQIRSMFQKDIDRPINGVIKVMQTDEENKRQELEEYVITRELRKHFGSFYSHYEQSVGGTTDKMGVWISGFFGSGKSHFLKILSYLLANDVVAGRHAVDYFEEKLAYDPLQYEVMRRAQDHVGPAQAAVSGRKRDEGGDGQVARLRHRGQATRQGAAQDHGGRGVLGCEPGLF